MSREELDALVGRVRACTLCADILAPRPVLRLSAQSKVLIVGQAPGSKVHASGIPWDDASGDHLRQWLEVDRARFEDASRFGILPMAFCYPGKGRSGDLPPPPRCARTWHQPLMQALDGPAMTLVVGQYAHKQILGRSRKKTLTDTVRAWREYVPDGLWPLPHPSWRSKLWMRRNTWFEAELLPELRASIRALTSP